MIEAGFMALLACPNCEDRPPLTQEGDKLRCAACGREYPIVDGIVQLLPESAIQPEVKSSDA